MLNDRRVPRGLAPTKRFRPALTELRPRRTPARERALQRQRTPERFRRIGWLRPIAVASLLAVVAVGALWSPEHGDRVTAAITHAQATSAEAFVGVERAWRRHLDQARLETALHDLERQNERLRIEVTALREADAERRRLAHLVQATGGWGLQGVGARVVAFGGGGRTTLRLDAGIERGIEPGLPVVGTRGVVGQVLAAGTGWSDVLAVTDPSHGLAGRIVDGPRGVLAGTRDGLRMSQVLSRHDVPIGSTVVSTGASGVFPPGLPIGTVARVQPDLGTPFWRIQVDAVAPPALLTEVLVVTSRHERPELAWR